MVPPESELLHQWLQPVFEATIAASGRDRGGLQTSWHPDGALADRGRRASGKAIVVAWRLSASKQCPALWCEQAATDRVRELSARPGLAFLYRGSSNSGGSDDLKPYCRRGLGREARQCGLLV